MSNRIQTHGKQSNSQRYEIQIPVAITAPPPFCLFIPLVDLSSGCQRLVLRQSAIDNRRELNVAAGYWLRRFPAC